MSLSHDYHWQASSPKSCGGPRRNHPVKTPTKSLQASSKMTKTRSRTTRNNKTRRHKPKAHPPKLHPLQAHPPKAHPPNLPQCLFRRLLTHGARVPRHNGHLWWKAWVSSAAIAMPLRIHRRYHSRSNISPVEPSLHAYLPHCNSKPSTAAAHTTPKMARRTQRTSWKDSGPACATACISAAGRSDSFDMATLGLTSQRIDTHAWCMRRLLSGGCTWL